MGKKILSFEEIDLLFLKYKKALFLNNTEQFVNSQKNLIIEELWRNIKSIKNFHLKLEEYPDVMIKVSRDCLKTFAEKEDFHGFSAYTFSSIKEAIFLCLSKDSFSDSTGGMHSTEENQLTRKKLKKLYKSYSSLRNSNSTDVEINNKFVEYASTYLNISKETVVDFLNPKSTTNIEIQIYDESINLADLYGCSNNQTPENIYYDKIKLKELLRNINEEWKNQKENSKSLMSELLTLIALNMLENIHISDKEELKSILMRYSFISNNILDVYFNNVDIKLPTQQELGEKYNLSKSGVSKKITRFFEKINKNLSTT